MAQWARPDGSHVSVVNDEGRLTQYAATRFSKGSLTAVRANALIPIEPGQWVLAFNDPYGPWPRNHRAAEYLMTDPEFGGSIEAEDLTATILAMGGTDDVEAKRFAATHGCPVWKGLASTWFQKTRKRRKAA